MAELLMTERTPRELGYRWPAEWEPQRATWLAWPHNESDWPGKFAAIRWVFCEMIRALAEVERVGLIVPSEASLAEVRHTLMTASVPVDRVDCVVAPTDRSWTRDYLPTWLLRSEPAAAGDPSAPLLGAVKWLFNGWARYPDHSRDEAAGRLIAERQTPLVWTPRRGVAAPGSRFVLEGGAIETDGEGTLLTTSDCLLGTVHARNPELCREDMERVLGAHLVVDKVLWLPAGVAGDDTSGHVDDVARFVGPARIVLARERNPNDENYAPLERAREYLLGERDARGRRVEVIDLPMPLPRHYAGERLPASYANFLIANERVLVPTFNDPSDRHVLGLLAELFPNRQVIGIHCLDLVLGLGSIHCSTHQEPLPP